MTSPAKTKKRPAIEGVRISPAERLKLYAHARDLPRDFARKSGLCLPFTTYFQDPFVAANRPDQAFDSVYAAWEPGLNDGPTSARFAVVDYNGDAGLLEPPAIWVEAEQQFVSRDGKKLDEGAKELFAFHQVNVWVLLQHALDFFEDGNALGRTITWAFEGNRLIVVPHAGYGQNAYYDRSSKSLQFYYFQSGEKTVYTCLSTDIVCHEFGHAVLDGVRPLLNESSSVETAAFHEFVGDLSALLLTMRNNSLRRVEADRTKGRISKAKTITSIAEEFGQAIQGTPYLRTAINELTMQDVADSGDPHRMSEALTGTMFDVIKCLCESYEKRNVEAGKKESPRTVFWRATDRMQRIAIQPLDLLPPVEVTFRDYALAVCRSQKLADPMDPYDYYGILVNVFLKRGILTEAEAEELKEPQYLTDRLDLSVWHNIDHLSRSRAAAYRFLDDNREDLLIPASRDFFVADLYDAHKLVRQGLPMPRQIILQYAWREDVQFGGPEFGQFDGRMTSMLCGGTLVFDDNGVVLSWMTKPGSQAYGGKRVRSGKVKEKWDRAVKDGQARRDALLTGLKAQIAAGRIGAMSGTQKGLLGSQIPPVVVEADSNEFLRFHLSPHMNLSAREAEESGERQWQISC